MARSLEENVIYFDPTTGETFTSMPAGKRRIKNADQLKEEYANTIKENYAQELPEVVVYPTSGKGARSTNLGSFYDRIANTTEKNYLGRINRSLEDERIARANHWEGIMNPLSPGQWVGAAIDASQGERDFLEGLWYGNSGWVGDKFAADNPKVATMINLFLDSAIGAKAVKAKSATTKYFTDPVNNPIKNAIELGMYSSRGSANLSTILETVGKDIKNNPKLFRQSIKYPFMKNSPKKTAISNAVQNYFNYNGLWHGAWGDISDVGFNPIRAGLYKDFGIMEPYVRTIAPEDIHYRYAINRGEPGMKIIDSPYEDATISNRNLRPGELDTNANGDIALGEISKNTGYKLDAAGHWERLNEDGTLQKSDAYKYNVADYIKRHGDNLDFSDHFKAFLRKPSRKKLIKSLAKPFEYPVLKLVDNNFNDFIYQSKAVKPKNLKNSNAEVSSKIDLTKKEIKLKSKDKLALENALKDDDIMFNQYKGYELDDDILNISDEDLTKAFEQISLEDLKGILNNTTKKSRR